MKNNTIVLLVLLLTALLQSCSTAKLLKQPVVYEPGYSVKFRQEVASEVKMTMFGMEETQISRNVTEFEYHVVAVLPDGHIKWETTFTRFSMKNEDGDGRVTMFDTGDPDRDTSDAQSQMFYNIIGYPMYMTTKADGQILEFSGADGLFDKMMGSLREKPEMKQFSETIKTSFSDSAMIESARNIWGNWPLKPVRIGEKWQDNRVLPGGLTLAINYTNTLKSRGETQAVILTKSKVDPQKPAEMQFGMFKIQYKLTGKGQGKILISQPEGLLTSGIHIISLKGIMQMTSENSKQTDIPISIKTTVTTLSKK